MRSWEFEAERAVKNTYIIFQGVYSTPVTLHRAKNMDHSRRDTNIDMFTISPDVDYFHLVLLLTYTNETSRRSTL
jgi:hypothetical protein